MKTNCNLRSESLFKIIRNSPYFEEAIELYVYSLSLKKSWRDLEDWRKVAKLNNANTNKLIEWERFARHKHMKGKENALRAVKMAAHALTESMFEELKIWLQLSECSKMAYKKKILSIDDGLGLMEARLVQLVYLYRVGTPIDLNKSFDQEEVITEKDHI